MTLTSGKGPGAGRTMMLETIRRQECVQDSRDSLNGLSAETIRRAGLASEIMKNTYEAKNANGSTFGAS